MFAAQEGYAEAIQMLLDAGADVNAVNEVYCIDDIDYSNCMCLA